MWASRTSGERFAIGWNGVGQPVGEGADASLLAEDSRAAHAAQDVYVPYAAADIDVRKRCARRRENDFQRLLMPFVMHHPQERAAHAKSLLAQLYRHDVRTPQAKFEGERTCRPAYASATCAYRCDHNHELSTPRPLAQVVG